MRLKNPFKKDQEQDSRFASFRKPMFSREVSEKGVVNDGMLEEYPHIYTFPLFNDLFIDFLMDAADEHIPEGQCSVELWDIHSDMEDIIRDKVLPKVNQVAEFLFHSIRFDRIGECYLLKLAPEHVDEYELGPGIDDYTLIISLANEAEGGSLYFPKQGVSRFRGVEPPRGGATLFPSVFEHGINPVLRGTHYSLVIPLII